MSFDDPKLLDVYRNRQPALHIALPLEGDHGVLWIEADSYEDEMRLRRWLRSTRNFRAIRLQLDRFLDELDALDRREAA